MAIAQPASVSTRRIRGKTGWGVLMPALSSAELVTPMTLSP